MLTLNLEGADPITGFKYLWLKSVTDFTPTKHCIFCLVGTRNHKIKPGMTTPRPIPLLGADGADFYYLCGVATTYRWVDNLHLAVRRQKGEQATVRSYDGRIFTIEDAVAMPIPPLADGYQGLGKSFTTCRNFQFGVAIADELAAKARRVGQVNLF